MSIYTYTHIHTYITHTHTQVIGLNVSGVSVAAVEADSEVQPRLILKHVVRCVDSTVESTLGKLRQENMGPGGPKGAPMFAL